MSDMEVSRKVVPYESASELREAHAGLLEALDRQIGQDASAENDAAALAQIETQVRQFMECGAAAGVYIEEIKERTACQVLLDYWVSSLSHAGMQVSAARLSRFDGQQLPDLKDKPCPYAGLEAFRDRKFFFGREAATQNLMAQVRDAPLIVVLGASGSGKSSLVMGGVLPALGAKGATPELRIIPTFVPGNAVLYHLADAVLGVCSGACGGVADEVEKLRQDPLRLCVMAGGKDAPSTLITIDQFEEVFTLSDEADREALVANLSQFLEAGQGHRVILTMREEFRSRMVELRAMSPYIDKAWYSMLPMGYEELKAAVDKPASLVNLQFQSGIVDDLVKKVLGQPAALPLLQFTLRSLWEKRDRNRITWEVYRKVGDPLNALKASADHFFDGLAPQTQDEVRRILVELVRVDELLEAYRQPVPKSRLLLAGKANTEEVLKLLADNDYVRITSSANEAGVLVEVKHESLVRNWPRFVAWIDEKRHQRRQRLALTQAADRWSKSGKPEEGLLTGWQAEAAKDQSDLSKLEKEFVQASLAAVDRMQQEKEAALLREAKQASARRFRRVAGLATVFIFALLVYSNWSVDKQRTIAQARSVLASADRTIAFDPELGALLALEAHESLKKINAGPSDLECSRTVISRAVAGMHALTQTRGPGTRGYAADFSLDGTLTATVDDTHTIHVWDTTTGEALAEFKGHTDWILALAFSSDGKRVVSASGDNTVRVWDVGAPHLKPLVLRDPDEVLPFAMFSHDTGNVLTVDWNGRLRNWDDPWDGGSPLPQPKDMLSIPDQLQLGAFSRDGRWFAAVGPDKNIVIRDISGRQKIKPLASMNRNITYLAFNRTGNRLVAGLGNDKLHIWDTESAKRAGVIQTVSGPTGSTAFSADGRMIIVVGVDNKATVFDVGTGRALLTLLGHKSPILSVAFLPNDDRIITVSEDMVVRTWNIDTLKPAAKRLGLPKDQQSLDLALFSADSGLVATLVPWALQHQVWEVESGEPLPEIDMIAAHERRVNNLAFSANNEYLVTAGEDNLAKVWNARTGEHIVDLKDDMHKGAITSVAFSPDGLRTVTGSADGTVLIWYVDSRKSEPLTKHGESVTSVEFSKEGQFVLSASSDGTARILDVDSRKIVKELASKGPGLTMATFSPDAKTVMTAGEDETIRIFDAASGEMLKLVKSQANKILSVAYSADSMWFVSAHVDSTVHVGSATSGEDLASLPGHSTSVNHAVFLQKGIPTVRTISADGSIRDIPCEVCVSEKDLIELAHKKLAGINRKLSDDERRIYRVR